MIGTSDFHVHSNASYDTDSDCTPEAIAEIAVALGIKEIGITDHVQAESEGAPGYGMPAENREKHNKLLKELRENEYPARLLAGWEVDYFDTGRYSFDPESDLADLDYVLLGHHFFHVPKDADAEFIARYLIRIYRELAVEPYADIIAHPFYVSGGPERHGNVLANIDDTEFKMFFSLLAEQRKVAEITAFQFSPRYRNVPQSRRLYKIALQTDVKFVLSSDAHHLSEIGDGLRCVPALLDMGFTENRILSFDELKAHRASNNS